MVSVPRSTLEELLIRDFSRSLHEMDTQSLPDVMQVLAHSLKQNMKAPSLPATPPRLASSTEQEAANQTDASPPQQSEPVPAPPPQAATTSTVPDTAQEGRRELTSFSNWKNRLWEEARKKQEAEAVLEATQARSTIRPLPSTAPEATVATPSQPLRTPTDTATPVPATPTQLPSTPQQRDITAELLGIQLPQKAQETESPAKRLAAAAAGVADFPVAVWTGLDKLFPEALRSTSGLPLTEEVQRAVFVTKGIIVVSSATLTALFVRHIAAALSDYLLRLRLVRQLLSTFQGLQANVLERFEEAQNEASTFDAQRQDGGPAGLQTGEGVHGKSGGVKVGGSMFDALFARVPEVGSGPAASADRAEERRRRLRTAAADRSLRATGATGGNQRQGPDPADPALRVAGGEQSDPFAAQRTLAGQRSAGGSSSERSTVDGAPLPPFAGAAASAAAPRSPEQEQRWEGGADGSGPASPPLPHPPGVRKQAGSGTGGAGAGGAILWQKGRQRSRPTWAAQGGPAVSSAELPHRPLETGGVVRVDEGGAAEVLPMSVKGRAQEAPVSQQPAGSKEGGPLEVARRVERRGQDSAVPSAALGEGRAQQDPEHTQQSDGVRRPPGQAVGRGDVTRSARAAPGGGAVPGSQGLPGQGARLLRGTGFVDPWFVDPGPAVGGGGTGGREARGAHVHKPRQPVDFPHG